MRNYWIRIAAKALGIFVVGMVIIATVRGVKHKVTSTINSSDPIPIPLIGLVPFRLGSSQLGSLSRIEFLRSDPQHVSGVRVVVSLSDSITAERLHQCSIALDQVDNIDEHTTFRCQAAGDSTVGLEPFGIVIVKGTSDSFPLMLPRRAVAELRETSFRLSRDGFEVTSPSDRARRALRERTDSMRGALEVTIDARQDSVSDLREQADDLEDAAAEAGTPERRSLEGKADSVRTQMRAIGDRVRQDELRLAAVDEVSGLSGEELDSLAHKGRQLSDSIHREVAKALRQAGVQVERSRTVRSGATSETVVEAAPPVPPKP